MCMLPGSLANKKKDVKKRETNQVKLDKKVAQIGLKLEKSFPNLTFIYESLFMGNDKQLLIYRSCTALDRYVEKYRLPNDFKKRLDVVNKTAENFYNKKM